MASLLDFAGPMDRRHFIRHLASTTLGIPAIQFFSSLRANAGKLKKANRSCIVLWMAGGPSHLDIWDLKPDSPRNGGSFKPIDTSANGVRITEHLPRMAKQMHHLSVIRSLDSKEGNHDRGSYLMHTGYAPNPSVIHPGWGSVCAYENAEKSPGMGLPDCISINSPGVSAGFLGMSYSPFVVQDPNAPVANLKPAGGIDQDRMARRLRMLGQVENQFIAQRRAQAAVDHKSVYDKTLRLMNSHQKNIFDLETEPARIRDTYGRSSFGSGCLMARRLVEQGVSYVEVALDGWDTHANNFDTLSRRLLPPLDQGMSALVADLADRGLLDSTLIVWMGEFGRTPRINQNAGRDHWPRSWSVAVGGAGIQPGKIVGATDRDGVEVTDRPVGVMDLIATMTRAMGIGLETEYITPRGRPMKVVDDGKVISELIG